MIVALIIYIIYGKIKQYFKGNFKIEFKRKKGNLWLKLMGKLMRKLKKIDKEGNT